MIFGFRIRRDLKIAVDPEDLANGQLHIRQIDWLRARGAGRRAHVA
jgi:hypothetical protein